jgi:ABC-2 type transport system permease protein
MRAALLIAARDLVSRLRDRSALVIGFVAPVALALIISFATGGGGDAFHADVAVVDEDGGDIAGVFVGDVLGSEEVGDVFTVRELATRADAVAALEAREVSAAFLVHDGLERITVLRSPTARIAGEIATGIAQNFAAQITGVNQAIGLTVMTTMFGPEAFTGGGFRPESFEGVGVDQADLDAIDFEALARAVADAPMPLQLVDASTGASELSSASYYGPGMAMLFVFFLLSAAPRSLLREAEAGTLARLRAAPISTASIVAGKALAVGVLGMTSMCVVWGVTALAFDASWGNPAAVLALLAAFVLAALGITTLVSVYARTESQADGFVSIVAFALAMLGGNFLFLGDLPVALQQIARLTPNGWALQGFTTLTADGGGVRDVLGPIAAVLAFAVAAFAAAVPGLRSWTTS